MSILENWTLWLAIAIIVFAILHTFWEVDREIRDPKTSKKLKEFYFELDALLKRKVSSEADVRTLSADFGATKERIIQWVAANMGATSVIRLAQNSPSGFGQFRMERQDCFDKEHGSIIDDILDGQRRILILIERPVWN